MNHKRVAIVGGGLAGLATAFGLCQRGVTDLLVCDAGGGKLATARVDGVLCEGGPNGFLDNKPSTLDLCDQLGLTGELVRADESAARRFVFLGDRLRELPASPGAFLRSDLLSVRGRLRVLAEPWVRGRPSNVPVGDAGFADESVYDFGVRRIGREATEKLLDTLVTGIHAGDPKLLSLPACFPRLAELEREHGSLIRAQKRLAKERKRLAAEGITELPPGRGTLTAPREGMGRICQRLREWLAEHPDVKFAGAAERLVRGERWTVAAGAHAWQTAAVVLACPAYAAAPLLRTAALPELAEEAAAIRNAPATVAVVSYHRADLPRPPNGFGYLAPQRLGRPVLGVIWSSCVMPGQAPEDRFAFRAILGGWNRPDVADWNDAAVVDAVRQDLRTTLNIAAEPATAWIRRWPRAIPQYHVGHLGRLARIESLLNAVPGLHLTGNSYRGVAVNDVTADADRTADQASHAW